MSQLEETAKPYMDEIIRGRRLDLSPTAQTSVASWAAKTTMTGSLATRQPVRHGWLSYMQKSHTPPPGWQVLIGRYDGTWPLVSEIHDINLRSPDPLLAIEHGILATFVLGYLAVKVLGIHHPDVVNPVPSFLQSVWPPVLPKVTWPPRDTWTDQTLQQFIDLFFYQPPVRSWSP